LVPTKEYCTGSLVGTTRDSCERLVPTKEYPADSLVGTNSSTCERLVPTKVYHVVQGIVGTSGGHSRAIQAVASGWYQCVCVRAVQAVARSCWYQRKSTLLSLPSVLMAALASSWYQQKCTVWYKGLSVPVEAICKQSMRLRAVGTSVCVCERFKQLPGAAGTNERVPS
jgi:hypothetical protein